MKFEDVAPFLGIVPVVGVLGWLLYRRVRYGSLVGAILGARSKEVVGEVQSERAVGVRQVFRVHVLEPDLGAAPQVALETTTRAWGSRKITASRLTPAQARDLAALLTRAAGR